MSNPSSDALKSWSVAPPALACFALLVLFGLAHAQTVNNTSRPQLTPNGRRYRESGLKPATGRSGSATLTARALLGKGGETTVEVTTGALDGGGARPGSINKARLKPLDENGEALYARNYTGLSGRYFKTTVNDLRRGQQVHVQANVEGIDAARTDVVTVVETVKLRPDLSPTDLSAPARGVPGSPVNVSAVVRELKGETGAAADLVLYADGVEVDRAKGVWVDAGGTVSCVFTHTFNSTGTKQLEVKAEGSAPGDYDLSNNAAAGSVEIVQPGGGELNYNVQVFDMDEDFHSRVQERRYFNGALQSEREEEFSARGWRQSANFYGWTGHMISFPVSVTHNEASDGAAVFSASYANLTPTSVIDASDGVTRFVSYNVWRYDAATGYYFNLYTNARIDLATGARTEMTSFSSNRQAGDVTYYSAGYERFWDDYSGEEFFYSWNTTEPSSAGARLALGTRHRMNVSLTAGDGAVYAASPEVTLSPFDNSGSEPYACFDWSFDAYSVTSCVESERVSVGRHGYTYKDSNP
ncbi:MAG TPA: hypothetical protein VF591_07130 [Pyrinomonadaceae bacterium]|jgi:hypothetical protein